MMTDDLVTTDLLIVGAGPAGASLACFLGSYGQKGIIIASSGGTADTPRAHITNAAGLECLRDIDLERECIDAGSHGNSMQHTRWCRSMAGEEFGRVYSWGHDPMRKGDYTIASPCSHCDLPQTRLEPILTRRAVQQGWMLRFNTTFVSIRKSTAENIDCEVNDYVTGRCYTIRCRYLFGCDGARSQVVRELRLPFDAKEGQGVALNILVRADLSHLIRYRNGNLHWVFEPDKERPPWGWACILRMVKMWDEWMFIFLPKPGADGQAPEMTGTMAEYEEQVRRVIGDDAVEIKILDASKWWINEIVAEQYSEGNMYMQNTPSMFSPADHLNSFCLGDSVHRHPPFNGLGSNTCIQDAFNLAWKVHYVLSGKAGKDLLDSYSLERQPVGAGVVARANQGLRDHLPWMTTIGLLEDDVEERKKILATFNSNNEAGRRKRKEWQEALEKTKTEFHGLGIEMNQRYASNAVFEADENGATPLPENPISHFQMTTFPGRRLPHAWLNTRQVGKPISTIDLAGHGCFCLLTGPGGDDWARATSEVSQQLSIEIRCYSIGWCQDYEDVYYDWARLREVEEDGCVLVRPDRFVAWRAPSLLEDCTTKLKSVICAILAIPP